MMRYSRFLSLAIVLVLVVALAGPSLVLASSSTTVVKLWVGSSVMSIGTKRQPIDAQGTKPVVVEGRTLVPIRAVIQAFQGSVDWDTNSQRVTVALGDNSLELWIGKAVASLNGSPLPIDSANSRVRPVILGGRTMLPIRFISESLGIDVEYETTTKMITLTYVVSASSEYIGELAIGDMGPAGGFVFYDKGAYSDGWRYLEAAASDQSNRIQWSQREGMTTGATGTAIGTGQSNTTAIVRTQGAGAYAAKLCDSLVVAFCGVIYDDWFLPSRDELVAMYENLVFRGQPLGDFDLGSDARGSDNSQSHYWSSSEHNESSTTAWYNNFHRLPDPWHYSKTEYGSVRAIRSF
jgi:hypothetical protein